MRFMFNVVFYPIAFLIIGLFLVYEPVATGIFLAVLFVISLIGGILLHNYRKSHR